MIKMITIADAQHQLAALVSQAVSGTEIIITDGKSLRVRLVPVQPALSQRVPGLHQGSIITDSDFDAPLPDDFWMGTL